MNGRNCKRMRRNQIEGDTVFLSCCSDCGGYSEIKENDKGALLSALNSGCLVMMSREDFKKIRKGEI